jgi:ABC-type Mn2+/Zn2+ transport system ATPase subunit
MQGQDEPEAGPPAGLAPAAPPNVEPAPAVITARALGVDGEHGPLFSDIDLTITPGFHAIQMPGGPAQDTLLLTLAGRLKPSHGTVTVLGDTQPRAIRRHCSIAAFADIDELEESVTVETVVAEQRRWLAPWYSSVPIDAGQTELAEVFGEIPPPSGKTYIVELSDLEQFLLRITLAVFSDRPILVVGDLEQVRDNSRRKIAVDRLGEIATRRTVVVGVTNPLGNNAPDHDLHDHRDSIGRD